MRPASLALRPDKRRDNRPPRKRAGSGIGPRQFQGLVMDLPTVAAEVGTSLSTIRSRVSRGELPTRKWGGRVVVLRPDLTEYLRGLPGITPKEAVANTIGRRGSR